jgi:hypothetical protein
MFYFAYPTEIMRDEPGLCGTAPVRNYLEPIVGHVRCGVERTEDAVNLIPRHIFSGRVDLMLQDFAPVPTEDANVIALDHLE